MEDDGPHRFVSRMVDANGSPVDIDKVKNVLGAAGEMLELLTKARGMIGDPGSITRRFETYDIGAEIDALLARIDGKETP